MAHSNKSLGVPKGGIAPSPDAYGGVQLGGQGPAVKLSGDGQTNNTTKLAARTTNVSGPAIRSTPGRTVAGTGKAVPS